MPKEDEYVCCGVRPCRSSEFKEYLEQTLTKSYLKEKFKKKYPSEVVHDLTDTEKLRRMCYKETSAYFHAKGWYPQDHGEDVKYAALPSCIVWTIRRHFEEKSGKYTGFPPQPELLKKVVDAHNTFRSTVDGYTAVVDVTNPDDGLFTTLQRLQEEKLKAVYDICRDEVRRRADVGEEEKWKTEERWTKSTKKGIELLPRLGFVACSTAFEAFLHDTIKRCFETVFPTMKVVEEDKEFWTREFDKELNSRIEESKFWNPEQNTSEKDFWKLVIPDVEADETETRTSDGNPTLLKLKTCCPKVVRYLIDNPMSQQAVGLVQEMVDSKKLSILGTLTMPTIQSIQDTFVKLAIEAPHNNGKRKFRENLEMPKPKRKRSSGASSRSPMTSSSSSMGSISSNFPSLTSTPETSRQEIPVPQLTSTPSLPVFPQSGETENALGLTVEYLAIHYARKYSWQIWLNSVPYAVNCTDAKTLSHLSNLFYGMRCMFCHGTPQKTIHFGALRVDRIPQEPADLNISVHRQNNSEEDCAATKKRCEEYLFDVAKDAKENAGEMKVDHDLFLTIASFYTYVVEITGGVAECIAYKCSDVKLRTRVERAARQKIHDIEKLTDEAWKTAASPISQRSQSYMDIAYKPQPDDPSEAEHQSPTAGPSTGITQDFADVSFS